MGKTLVLIKPNVFEDFKEEISRVIADILGSYTKQEIKIIAIRHFIFTKEEARRFYQEHERRPFFQGLIDTMANKELIGVILEGENVVDIARDINGATNPQKADIGTIRHKYGRHELGPNNAVHGSDSRKSAEREIKMIFPEA